MLNFVEELLILIVEGENNSQAHILDRTRRYALAGAVLMSWPCNSA